MVGSDEAFHDVHAALGKMVALLLSLLRMLEDGDATFSPQPPNQRDWKARCHTSRWSFDCPSSPTKPPHASQSVDFPGTAIVTVSPYFIPAPVKVGLLP